MGVAEAPDREGDENAGEPQRQSEPGQRIGQVVVGDVEHRLAPLRKAARDRRYIGVDGEGSDTLQPLRGGGARPRGVGGAGAGPTDGVPSRTAAPTRLAFEHDD